MFLTLPFHVAFPLLLCRGCILVLVPEDALILIVAALVALLIDVKKTVKKLRKKRRLSGKYELSVSGENTCSGCAVTRVFMIFRCPLLLWLLLSLRKLDPELE
jgi:hypothetical protein